jgi:putative peptidoglycan lipid II flippase
VSDEPVVIADPTAATSTAGLVRSSAVVAAGTALSRVTGLLRIAAIGYALGTLRLADAYNTANNTPNILFELVLGGILSATLVPVFVGCFADDDEDGISAVITVAVVALAALTVTAIVAAPLIFRAYTWRSTTAQADELASVGVPLLRLLLPQIFFYGLTALGTALLNARRKFGVPAFAPVLNNVVVCTALVVFARTAGQDPTLSDVRHDRGLLWLLGAGTTAGIIAMTVVLWPAVRRSGARLRWRFAPKERSVRRVAALSGWTVGYVAVNQIALAIVVALALRQPGDQAAYTYAFVFFQLPHGLFAVSIMTTFVPDLASLAARADWEGYRDRFGLGLRLLLLVLVPASVGYFLLGRPLVTALLARGALDTAAAERVGDTLAAFALGLVGFSIYLFALRGFYALQDTRTPFFLNVLENGLNIVLALLVVGALEVQGLALSYSAAYAVAAVAALLTLRRRTGGLELHRALATAVKVVVAAAAMAVVVLAVRAAVGGSSGSGAALRAATGVVAGAATYVTAVVLLRVDEVNSLVERFRGHRATA